MMVWIAWDYIFRDKPSLIGAVNGMITGLVGITPAAGFVNGYGAIIIGVVDATIVWMAIRYLSRAPMFRHVDDTLGVIYTHGIAGLTEVCSWGCWPIRTSSSTSAWAAHRTCPGNRGC